MILRPTVGAMEQRAVPDDGFDITYAHPASCEETGKLCKVGCYWQSSQTFIQWDSTLVKTSHSLAPLFSSATSNQNMSTTPSKSYPTRRLGKNGPTVSAIGFGTMGKQRS